MDKVTENDIRVLINAAAKARENSYSPYSHYRVGAALLTGDGRIFEGCNIENASYGLTNCAERTAFFKAVSAIAIVGGIEGADTMDMAYPCGACRQVMREFAPPSFMIIVARDERDYQVYTLDELFPHAFGPDNLK